MARQLSRMPSVAAFVVAVALAVGAVEKTSVTGEVIDSACYVKSGAKGESHRTCAQKCADVGIPLALLEDGSARVIWLASIDDMQTPNAMLRPHAARRVTVEGTWVERGGARLFLVETVRPAAK